MAASNAIDVKAAIKTLIQNLNSEWTVSWGPVKTIPRVLVYIGEVAWDETRWVTNRSVEENFRVKIAITYKARRTTPEECETQAFDISKQIQAAVKASPNLGDAAVVIATYKPVKADNWPEDDFWTAQIEAEINVTARF